jgi:hypothetical protein
MEYIKEKIYSLIRSLYISSRSKYDTYFTLKPDYTIKPRSISLVQLNKNNTITKHDITVEIKDNYIVSDIYDFIKKSQINLQPKENEYFVVIEYMTGGGTYKYMRELPPETTTLLFPVYTSDEIEKFNIKNVPNGVILSSINDIHDITDELHMHAGPKGNFYSDLENHDGFQLKWISLLENVPHDIQPVSIEILTYHGKTYVFSNENGNSNIKLN